MNAPSDPVGTPDSAHPSALAGCHLHLDCASGLAGDMFLGACLDLGMPLSVLETTVEQLGLERLGLDAVGVEARKAHRGGIAGTRFRVLRHGVPVEGPDPEERPGAGLERSDEAGRVHQHDVGVGEEVGGGEGYGPSVEPGHHHGDEVEHAAGAEPDPTHDNRRARDNGPSHDPSHSHGSDPSHSHGPGSDQPGHEHHDHHHGSEHQQGHAHGRTLAEIRRLIESSELPPAVRERALSLFQRLGEAEAAAHGMPVDQVHFHEVGAVDSIVDLVGAAAAFEFLAPQKVSCGPVNVGGGTVETAHGRLPVPPPAAASLLAAAQVPVYGSPVGELLTPTGAVLLAELVDEFGTLPPMSVQAAGYGHGRRELPGWPNSARIVCGRPLQAQRAAPKEGHRVTVIETEIDDLPGEGFGHLMDRLLAAGALDVYFTPVQMKKSRPGTLVTLLCRSERRDELAATLLAESGSLGCRFHEVDRLEADRRVWSVSTPWGEVRIKSARLGERSVADSPEFEDCRRLAEQAGVPWREVHAAALAAVAASRRKEEAS